jgi:hypothetical protein
LEGKISAKSSSVKVGEDILISFELQNSKQKPTAEFYPTKVRDTHSIYVWDGKYSNGYRNYSFEVLTPNGKSYWLQPSKIREWSKNAPHLVEILPEKPYALPEWYEGEIFKSLKKLGLDTTQPGIYRITGIYSEVGNDDPTSHKTAWGGELATAPIEVKVLE